MNKTIIVTGATAGFGKAIAVRFAKNGYNIIITGRRKERLNDLEKELLSYGKIKVLSLNFDVRKQKDVASAIENLPAEWKNIDILVNNAGVSIPQWAVDVTEETWDQIFNTNLKGLFFCAQAVGKVMIQQKKGKIINISSQSGSVGLPQRTAYCSSKGGVNLLTKVLAIEWAKYNIHVNAIAPTYIQTPMTKPMLEKDEFRNYVLKNIPLGRVGKPEDVIGAVIYLASEASNMVTGHVLLIDGGWTAH
jgi:NAD(P)-dependent dehydrogenase (short-subunit alcohol dehydrogenase family)